MIYTINSSPFSLPSNFFAEHILSINQCPMPLMAVENLIPQKYDINCLIKRNKCRINGLLEV